MLSQQILICRAQDIDINMPMQVKFVINFGRKRLGSAVEIEAVGSEGVVQG